jgi:hypothetical protein
MNKYFSGSLEFLHQVRGRYFNRLNRLQRTIAVAALTILLIFVMQVRAYPNIFEEFVGEITTEARNCISGGCDPTRREVWQSVANRAEEVSTTIRRVDWQEIAGYYTNPTSAYRALWGEFANVADTALNGIISRNFGHVTNKSALRSALESQGIVVYGHEISQDDYIEATRATAASVATSNPAPLIQYFLNFATQSYQEMLTNLTRALEEAPAQYTQELQRLQNTLTPQFIATALATYVSTGEIPQVSFNVDLSKVNVRFGILTYSRGERYPGGVLVTPNTHQPYIIFTPPTLGARVEQILRENTVTRDQVVTDPQFVSADLLWYRHNGWQNGDRRWASRIAARVGSGWGFKSVFASSGGVIYGINPNNDLLWYKHNGWQDGSTSFARGSGTKVGSGWNFKTVFATSNGIIYAVKDNGDLLWYKHNGWQDGSTSFARGSGTKVGSGWNFKTVFATSNGIIYAVKDNGDLLWYKHNGWQDGSTSFARGSGTKVGSGWNFKTVFATSNGIIYAVKDNGDLLWYKHNGWQDGSTSFARDSGTKIGSGWSFKAVFATSDATVYGVMP